MMKTISLLLLLLSLAAFGQNQNISNSNNFNGEPYLAINPTNPDNIVIAWMRVTAANRPIRTRASFDGGNTWLPPVDLPIVNSNTADPTMAFDNSGVLHLCFIDHLGTSASTNIGAVYAYSSSDGGLTWGNQSMVIDINADGAHQPIDRPWLVCDRSGGSNDGYLYITTKTVAGGPAPYHPYFLKSTDGGSSWSNWRYVDTTGWLSGISSTFAAPTVTNNGVFCSVYPSYVSSQFPLPRYIMAYTDGGASNTFDYKVSINNLPTVSNDSAKRGWQFLADPINDNHLAFLYTSGVNGDLDILMTETFDFGDSWTSSIRINDDPIGNGVLQDMIWASFDDDGDLAVCWRDRRNGNGSGYAQPTEIFGRVRWKDSINFSSSFIVSDTLTQHNNILAEAGNDFMCHQMLDDTLYITWGDTRTGFLNIWFDKIALSSGASAGIINLTNDETIVNIYPNPSNDVVMLDVGNQPILSIKIIDSKGALLSTTQKDHFSVKGFLPGTYYIVIATSETRTTKKLIVN